VVRAVARPFTAERRRPRHRAHAAFAAANPGAWPLALGVLTLHAVAETCLAWWRDPRARRMRLAALATAATPALLGLALLHPVVRRLGLDWLTPFSRAVYGQDALAETLRTGVAPPPLAAADGATVDLVGIGGGPGGATAATFLARGGLRVGLVEREAFPRFHVGESLLPANLPLLERIGVLESVRGRAFIAKYGASFHDQESGQEYTFYFRDGQRWPNYSFEVPRAEFDQILLTHAASQPGVTVLQPSTVETVAFDADGLTAHVRDAAGTVQDVRARFLVDASGRDAFVGSRLGRRRPVPGLGKVALFAHFRGARRWPGREEGNIRIYVFPDGWFWWIPFAGDTTSVGCVLHARTARGRTGSPAELYEEMIRRCGRVAEALRDATRITDVHPVANFSYRVDPVIGDRFLCVGDAVTFVDPIFSAGVYVAMQSAELATKEILAAFRDNRFSARRFRGYERRFRRGTEPFFRFIRNYYEPSFLEIFLRPRNIFGMLDSVTGVLAGGAFVRIPWRMRLSLELFFAIVRFNRWVRWRHGRPIESRLDW
jgi:2-polyprenyl-6-methoxyphenol hydroxylase-like FAD-dependent oxidoreductase